MPAIRINTQDKDLAEKTFHIILRNCRFDYLPKRIYVVSERDFEWLNGKNLPIEVLSEEEVRKSVSEFKKNPLYHLVGIGKGGPPDGAENHDKYLYGRGQRKVFVDTSGWYCVASEDDRYHEVGSFWLVLAIAHLSITRSLSQSWLRMPLSRWILHRGLFHTEHKKSCGPRIWSIKR